MVLRSWLEHATNSWEGKIFLRSRTSMEKVSFGNVSAFVSVHFLCSGGSARNFGSFLNPWAGGSTVDD